MEESVKLGVDPFLRSIMDHYEKRKPKKGERSIGFVIGLANKPGNETYMLCETPDDYVFPRHDYKLNVIMTYFLEKKSGEWKFMRYIRDHMFSKRHSGLEFHSIWHPMPIRFTLTDYSKTIPFLIGDIEEWRANTHKNIYKDWYAYPVKLRRTYYNNIMDKAKDALKGVINDV